MTPTDNKRQHRELWLWIKQEVGVDMGLDMMNVVQGLLFDNSKRTRRECTDKQRADKPWGIGYADSVYIVPGNLCFFERFVHHSQYDLYVASSCYLRYDTA